MAVRRGGESRPAVHCYPEMNARIVELLRISGSPIHLYAAQRIEDLEREVVRLRTRETGHGKPCDESRACAGARQARSHEPRQRANAED